jgi:hypothetical protein
MRQDEVCTPLYYILYDVHVARVLPYPLSPTLFLLPMHRTRLMSMELMNAPAQIATTKRSQMRTTDGFKIVYFKFTYRLTNFHVDDVALAPAPWVLIRYSKEAILC